MNKFITIIKMALSDAIIYRIDLLIYVVSGIIKPLIFLSIWLAAIASGGKAPLNRDQFIQYYFLAMLVGTFVNAWSAPFLSAKIRTGRLSPFLLRPFPYIFFDFGNNLGEKIFKCFYFIPLLIILGIIFQFKFPLFNPIFIIISLTSLVCAIILNYLLDIIVGMTAFWTDDSTSIREMDGLLTSIFSGWLFPLAILPTPIQKIAYFLPYRYTLSFPIEAMMGTLSMSELFSGMAVSSIWLLRDCRPIQLDNEVWGNFPPIKVSF